MLVDSVTIKYLKSERHQNIELVHCMSPTADDGAVGTQSLNRLHPYVD